MGPRAGAALPLSPASALRSPVFISHVRLASHQEFRLNAFQVMEEGADPGGLSRWGPELTLMPSPLTTGWAWGGTQCPTAPVFSSHDPQTPKSWCKPLPFFKKDLFLLLIYCFWHSGKPSSSHSSHPRHGASGGERLACPGAREAWPPYRGHFPRALSPWVGHITPLGEEGALSPCPLCLRWARCSPGLTCEHASPLPRTVPTTAPRPGQSCCCRRLDPMI